jgi:hypothetical protein
MRLKTVLTEYRSIRDEVMKNTGIRTQITGIAAGFSGVIVSVALSSREPLAFAIMPLVVFLWALIMRHSYEVHLKLSKHIVNEIQERIAELIGYFREKDGWISWDAKARVPPRLGLFSSVPFFACLGAILGSVYLLTPRFRMSWCWVPIDPRTSILFLVYVIEVLLAMLSGYGLWKLRHEFAKWQGKEP